MTGSSSFQRFLAELKRRKVFRVAAVYGATAFVTVEAADLVFPRIPLPEWTVTLVVWLALLGFPVALALAWAYEATPEGVRPTDPMDAAELDAIVAQPRRRRWPAGIAALVGIGLLALGAWWTFTRTGPGATSYDSIAVLPFTNLSGNPENQYFSDGLAEELLNALAGVGDLKVAGRTSSFALRDADLDLRSIGDTLGVATVLEGSVRRSENKVRIAAQLIDSRTGFHLWSREYDRDLTDIFQVQEELARDIVRALLPRLGRGEEQLYRGGTSDVEAYDLYLAGRQKWYTRKVPLLLEAVDDFEAAVARDPNFALGWSGLADAIDALAYRDIRGQPLVARGKMAAQRAVLLDPELAEGWASWGVLAFEADGEWTTAELALKRALELKPSYASAHAWLGDMLRSQGRIREAIEQQRKALELDPLSPVINGTLGMSLALAGHGREARAQIEKNLRTGGDPTGVHSALLWWGTRMGLTPDEVGEHAVSLARLVGAADPEAARVIGLAMAEGGTDEGLRSRAREAIDTLVAEGAFNGPRFIAALYAGLGERELAIEWLEKGAAGGDISLYEVGVDPVFDPIRDDPRMQRLMEELGLPNGYDPEADTYEPAE